MRLLSHLLLLSATAFAQLAGLDDLADQLGRKLAEKKAGTVTVLRFSNSEGYDPKFGNWVADQVGRRLTAQGRGIQLIKRIEVEPFLRGRHTSEEEPAAEAVQAFGQERGVKAVVTGSFTVLGKALSLDANILDTVSGNTIDGASGSLEVAQVSNLLVKGGPTTILLPAAPAQAGERGGFLGGGFFSTEPQGAGTAGEVDKNVAMPVGTVIPVVFNHALNSRNLTKGQELDAHVFEDVLVNGNPVVQRGAKARLVVVDSAGRILLNLVSVEMVDGETRRPAARGLVKRGLGEQQENQNAKRPSTAEASRRITDILQSKQKKGDKIGGIAAAIFGNPQAPAQNAQELPAVEIPANAKLRFTLSGPMMWR